MFLLYVQSISFRFECINSITVMLHRAKKKKNQLKVCEFFFLLSDIKSGCAWWTNVRVSSDTTDYRHEYVYHFDADFIGIFSVGVQWRRQHFVRYCAHYVP